MSRVLSLYVLSVSTACPVLSYFENPMNRKSISVPDLLKVSKSNTMRLPCNIESLLSLFYTQDRCYNTTVMDVRGNVQWYNSGCSSSCNTAAGCTSSSCCRQAPTFCSTGLFHTRYGTFKRQRDVNLPSNKLEIIF